jgi:NADH-quinone oxidoreductase subunit N
MIVVSKFSTTFSSLFIGSTIFLVALGHNFYENHQSKISDYIAIKIFLLAGCCDGFFWKLSNVLFGISIIYCIYILRQVIV